MKKSYDYDGAESLVPLLRVLNREIQERSEAIRGASRQIRKLRASRRRLSGRELRHQVDCLRAEIANQKREVRLAERELSQLGCSVDATDPTTVLIPGRDGNLEGGYSWRPGDSHVHTLGDTRLYSMIDG